MLDGGIVAPFGFEIDPVLVLLQDRLVLGIEETVVELETVVPHHLVLGVIGVGIDEAGQGIVVVTARRPVPQGRLTEIDIGHQGVGPVIRLRGRGFLLRGFGDGGGSGGSGLLRIGNRLLRPQGHADEHRNKRKNLFHGILINRK